jgi:recombination protein RecA
LPLNYAISGDHFDGGLPQGRISEIYGPESSGKTLIATMAMIETQRRGGLAVFLDYEHAFSIKRAVQLGLVTSRDQWIYKQPETAEEGFQIVEFICDMVSKEGITKPVTIVKDSVAAMITQEEMEKEIGEENMRSKLSLAACMSANVKKIAKAINKTNVTLIFLNQIRTNPGVMYGDNQKTTGGNALKFYASVRIKLHKGGKIREDDKKEGDVIGEEVAAEVIKNKVSIPFRKADYISSFTEGVNLHRTHLECLKGMGRIVVSGSWYSLPDGTRLGQGAANVEKALREQPALYARMMGYFKDEPTLSIEVKEPMSESDLMAKVADIVGSDDLRAM